MLDIAQNDINSVNGLAGDDVQKVAKDPQGSSGSNWSDTAQSWVNTLTNSFVTVNASLNHQGNSSSNSGDNININTTPGRTSNSSQSDIMDYLPWILGGLGAILLVAVVTKKK